MSPAKKTIALLSGGISSEREISLQSGRQVLEALDSTKYTVRCYDPKTDLPKLMADADEIDAALIVLHGPYGEDGTIQGLLELLDIPYQGTGVLGSALAMNKIATKQFFEKENLPVPPYKVIRRSQSDSPELLIESLGLPLVVKPVCGGSSIGMSVVHEPSDVERALAKAFEQEQTILVEAYIQGIEITCAVLGNDKLEAFPLIEIVPDQSHDFFDYEAKYSAGITQEICPARISRELTEKAQSYAIQAHQALFCAGYSRTDMIVCGEDLFILETNTIPGMTPTSLFPQAAQAAGISFSELLDRLLELGIQAHHQR
jgi:D-alanine-D-alanine ligase